MITEINKYIYMFTFRIETVYFYLFKYGFISEERTVKPCQNYIESTDRQFPVFIGVQLIFYILFIY